MRALCSSRRCDAPAWQRVRLCRDCLARLPGELRATLLRHQRGSFRELSAVAETRALAAALPLAMPGCRVLACERPEIERLGFCAECFLALPLELRVRIASERAEVGASWELGAARRWLRHVETAVALLELTSRPRRPRA